MEKKNDFGIETKQKVILSCYGDFLKAMYKQKFLNIRWLSINGVQGLKRSNYL